MIRFPLCSQLIRMGVILLIALAGCAICLAQGGPPLITDDPGTVPNGKWEINVAWINTSFAHSTDNEVPHFDANRGISDKAHFKIEIPWIIHHEGGEEISGDGGGSVGVKYRFIDGKGSRPSVSTYPQIGFSLSPRSVRLGVAEGGTSLLMPLQIEWDHPRLNVNADMGVVMQAGSSPGWIGGVAVGHERRGTEMLAEIHGEGVWQTGESNWIAQLGFRRDIGKQTLLFAFGKTIAKHNSDRVDWTSYLGLQFHI